MLHQVICIHICVHLHNCSTVHQTWSDALGKQNCQVKALHVHIHGRSYCNIESKV